MEYNKVQIEGTVRRILQDAGIEANARQNLIVMCGRQLPQGVSLVGGTPQVRFRDGIRSASFTLAHGGDDPEPMHIRVEVLE